MKRIGITVVCIAALLQSSCSVLSQHKQVKAPEPVTEGQQEQTADSEVKKEAAADAGQTAADAGQTIADAEPTVATPDIVPSSEQQQAAMSMLNGEDPTPLPVVESAPGNSPLPVETAENDSAYATSGVPGGRGLRMGSLAPPEEAASTNSNAAPKPNSVEMHGFRSPSLPKGLPMDINGKLSPSN